MQVPTTTEADAARISREKAADQLDTATMTLDVREGFNAFLEKRQGIFCAGAWG